MMVPLRKRKKEKKRPTLAKRVLGTNTLDESTVVSDMTFTSILKMSSRTPPMFRSALEKSLFLTRPNGKLDREVVTVVAVAGTRARDEALTSTAKLTRRRRSCDTRSCVVCAAVAVGTAAAAAAPAAVNLHAYMIRSSVRICTLITIMCFL